MADSYIKSYLACEKAYNGLNREPVYPDLAASEAQQNFENYLKNLKNGAGDLQALHDSYGKSQTITDTYTLFVDDPGEGGGSSSSTQSVDFSDDNTSLNLPPKWDTDLGVYSNDAPDDDTPHSSNNFTAQFFNSLGKLAGNSVLDQLSGGLSDDDYHSTLGNLTSPADQEKLVAIREKIQPLRTFFTALQKSANAVLSNEGASQNVTLDLPDGSVALSSSEFAKMLSDRINNLNNLSP